MFVWNDRKETIHKSDRGWHNLLKNVHIWGSHHSSVISSAPTSLQPRVRIPSTQSTLFQYVVHFETVRMKINKKRPEFAHIYKN